jgi:hypothetical protein
MPPGVQPRLKLLICRRAPPEAFGFHHEIPVEIDVLFVGTADRAETEWIKRMNENDTNSIASRHVHDHGHGHSLEQGTEHCRAEKPFHSVDPAGDDQRIRRPLASCQGNVNCEPLSLRPTSIYTMRLNSAPAPAGRPAEAFARRKVIRRKNHAALTLLFLPP